MAKHFGPSLTANPFHYNFHISPFLIACYCDGHFLGLGGANARQGSGARRADFERAAENHRLSFVMLRVKSLCYWHPG